MEWTWANERDDKEIKRWLKAVKRGEEAKGDFDFIADVRSGDLCFDLIVREYDEDDYEEAIFMVFRLLYNVLSRRIILIMQIL